MIIIVVVANSGGCITFGYVRCTSLLLCFEGCLNDRGSTILPFYMFIPFFFGQCQSSPLSVWSIFLFVIGVQQELFYIRHLLFSLVPMRFAYYEYCHVVFPHLRCYLIGPLDVTHCPDIPCTYKSCNFGCYKVHQPRDIRRILTFIMRCNNTSFNFQGRIKMV